MLDAFIEVCVLRPACTAHMLLVGGGGMYALPCWAKHALLRSPLPHIR